ncbi:MAG: aldehyde dehydrogenase family protein [Tepidimonas sp.]|uniref:aldehyde dehydrogenase family protein n=1 Tax=Tepidimonas sp. TaxID=2002775 RepID=UPI00298EF9C3|nr:aldehyde dehydrogenase family protein [Tepidimonas sp.]MDW8335478.1 aldehyde dehydrogenase family protein [Tepidimonas sp.]
MNALRTDFAALPPDDIAAALGAQLERMRHAFARRAPTPAAQRQAALARLLEVVLAHEADWIRSIEEDFGRRSATETRLLELAPLADEIRHLRRHVARWMRPRRVPVNPLFWPARARIVPQPLGVVGIIGAWNYPLQLTLSPLANALAAGNHVLLKPSELAPRTAECLRRVLAEAFSADEVCVVTGGAEVAAALARLPLDHLLFTGSTRVGRLVAQAAAAQLTPLTLELGGKSPAIVGPGADLAQAADRIVTAKGWNAGQTCIAPDHCWVPRAQRDDFVQALRESAQRRWPRGSADPDLTALVSGAAWQRMVTMAAEAAEAGATLVALLEETLPAVGQPAPAPAVLGPVAVLDPPAHVALMREEIFGPLLPVLTYDTLEEALASIQAGPRPLALYLFERDRATIERVLTHTVSGGVTVNDCMLHHPQHALPFGGVGASGYGAYHGRHGFERFSHLKGVFEQHPWVGAVLDRWVRPPYGAVLQRGLRFMLRR